jgi:stage V sporulation protein SpoVS
MPNVDLHATLFKTNVAELTALCLIAVQKLVHCLLCARTNITRSGERLISVIIRPTYKQDTRRGFCGPEKSVL